MKRVQEITAIALFAALSAVLQLSPLKIVTQWGMKIDLVAVPVLIAFFLFGFRVALETSIVMFLVISVVSPTGLIGATMKWMATVPMFIVPTVMAIKIKERKGTMLLGSFISMIALIALFGSLFILLNNKEMVSHLLVAVSCIVFYLGFWILSKDYNLKKSKAFKRFSFVITTLFLALIVRGVVTTVINYYFAIPLFFGMPTETAIERIPWYVIIGLNAVQGAIDIGGAWYISFKTGVSTFLRR
ncbi:MAG: hypothetical protein U9N35_01890 [Euryarchaeota archaeon]|nr:hypothetical protein [Euryarchaeota archaeon]